MNIENQLTSLKLSQKLEKLGIKQESLFYWAKFQGKMTIRTISELCENRGGIKRYSAFSVAELGELLPYSVNCRDKETLSFIEISKIGNEWEIVYRVGCAVSDIKIRAKTEANARAKMLVYLIENKLVPSK